MSSVLFDVLNLFSKAQFVVLSHKTIPSPDASAGLVMPILIALTSVSSPNPINDPPIVKSPVKSTSPPIVWLPDVTMFCVTATLPPIETSSVTARSSLTFKSVALIVVPVIVVDESVGIVPVVIVAEVAVSESDSNAFALRVA